MERVIVQTKDGSMTLTNTLFDESYHSLNGALTESMHTFVINGLGRFLNIVPSQTNKTHIINVLEIGFGSGLNAMATALWCYNRQNISINYYGIEKYPLTIEEHNLLKYHTLFESRYDKIISNIITSPWNCKFNLYDNFTLSKIEGDIMDCGKLVLEYCNRGEIDVLYFDAFSPEKQPHLWSEELFKELYEMMSQFSILTTYSSKGVVKRALTKAGFSISRVPGAPGKRHMIIAYKGDPSSILKSRGQSLPVI